MEFDVPRAHRIVGEWVDDKQAALDEQSGDQSYESPEALVNGTSEDVQDLLAMKSLHKQLERDCE